MMGYAYSTPRQAPEPTNIRPIRPVRSMNEESEADYLIDGVPVQRGRDTVKSPSRHVTMISDDVVDEVMVKCGLAAAGLYMKLERRVGKDGTWISTNAELARQCGCTDRHIRDSAATLEKHGFLKREPVTAYGGATIANRWILPKHMRTYGAEPTPEPRAEPTPELSRVPVLGVSNYVVVTGDSPLSPQAASDENTSADDLTKTTDQLSVVPSQSSSADRPSRPGPLPQDFAVTEEMRRKAVDYGVPPDKVDLETDKWRFHHQTRGNRFSDWVSSWLGWMTNAPRISGYAAMSSLGQHRPLTDADLDALPIPETAQAFWDKKRNEFYQFNDASAPFPPPNLEIQLRDMKRRFYLNGGAR